jgi:AcrR family transcriptional regulator
MNPSTSRKRGRPVNPQLHAQRRQEILEVAIRLFGQQGYAATDTQQLADALGVGKGTIYRYFRSKRELFYAALRHVTDKLDEEIRSSIAEVTDPLQVSFRAIAAYLRFFQAHPSAVQLLLQELAHFRQEGLPVYFQYRQQNYSRWISHVQGLIAAKTMRPLPAETVVEILGDSLFGIMLANHLNNRERPPEIQAHEVMDVFYNGLLTEEGRRRLASVREL